ncbi:MAG: DUF47 family protein [Elusimicrobiota bacterium]
MPIFFKMEEKVHKMIFEYLDTVDACMRSFHETMTPCMESGREKTLPDYAKTHKLESKADDLRRDIALTLFGRALLPESRYDILNILDSIDRVPNAAETVLAAMQTERIYIPEKFKPEFRELIEINIEAASLLRKSAEAIFTNPKQVLYLEKEVDIRESASDRLERKLVSEIFDESFVLDKADKLLLKNTVFHIGAIADRAENAADHLGIIAIKRRI